MCNFDAKSVPSGWQWICTRKAGDEESVSCSVFCAPSGRVFKSLEAVHAHNREEEKAKLEKEMRRSMKQENVVNKVNVNNSVRLVCNYCQETFFNNSALKKHEREVHIRSYPRQQISNFQQQYNPREVESHMIETLLNKNKTMYEKSGIAVSGISMKTPKPDLNKVRLERNQQQASIEPKSRLSMLKGLSIARKPRQQPLGPEIMEQYLALNSNSNFQPNSSISNPSLFTNQQPQVETEIPAKNVRNSMDTLAKFETEYRQLQVQSSQTLSSLPSQLPPQYSQSLPIIREQAISHARRRDISLPVRKVQDVTRNGPKKVLKKVLKSKPMTKKTSHGSNVGKHQITVSMACRFLGLKDYPVPINEFNKQFFEVQSVFEAYFLPLAASVNMGANPLSIKTLVKAKWAEVQKSKIGECKSIYFSKPRRNKVMVNVTV